MTFRLAALALLLLCAASAQSLDLAAGLGGVKSGTASDITGVFLSVSGTAMVKPNFGANADLAWSSPEISFGGPSGTRPLLFSLNFVARDPLPNFAPEVQFGYGLERVGGMCSNCVSGPGFSTISPIHRSGVHFGLADTAYVASSPASNIISTSAAAWPTPIASPSPSGTPSATERNRANLPACGAHFASQRWLSCCP